MTKQSTVRSRSKPLSTTFGFTFLFSFFVVFVVFSFANSLFVRQKDRVNLVIQTEERVAFYSISTKDDVNYLIYFHPDSKIIAPGGYQYYRFGALTKLAYLDKKPELLKKAFSSATSSFTDFYFYPANPQILYGSSTPDQVYFPTIKELFLYQSNANFLDRIFLYFRFLSSAKPHFNLLPSPDSVEDYAKKYQGFFYNKTYRKEHKLVQIIYTKKYKTADLISRILEGSGIQVVDISFEDKPHNSCIIAESSSNFSKTSEDLAHFFGCKLQKGNTGTFDILFILGNREDDWEA